MEITKEPQLPKTWIALVSGGVAGMLVDFSLFPLDTIKTRLQSEAGFWKSGGFRHIYSGVGSALAGSAPNAALFFCTYETTKKILLPNVSPHFQPVVHMVSASLGEITACLIRVPVEVVKQRSQTTKLKSTLILRQTLQTEGIRGFYRGYFSTITREVPFSLIQFPLWEYFKRCIADTQQIPIAPWQSTICGAAAGGIAAFLTTPLDVAKTRIMLAEKGTAIASGNVIYTLQQISQQKGVIGLFAGGLPRVLWISIGGAIFLGGYEKCSQILQTL